MASPFLGFDLPGLWSAKLSPTLLLEDWEEYLSDTVQRTVLVADVLRRRGNRYVEHVVLGRPPVLTFDYETVLDGRTLPHPSNYLLLRIKPSDGTVADPSKRPIVIFDPRAGHGPGIAGFKPDSQVGLALQNGYPCYFVSFLPYPVPGQTLEDVARSEVAFLQKVKELHPEADDRPVVIGNCQAGWAVAILSAVAPELMSVVILNGAPLSYWSGEVGKNPMRYLGGLVGGTWLAALTCDLGNGLFDGVNLVSNFENLDPANTLWKKPYNLFANVDTEAPRFLEFERWWGGFFLMTREEMRFITNELFVGNKLSSGAITGSSGRHVDLRAIKAPIVVFCSKGDNITPPQQALNWILDVYQSADDIKANGQVIIYMLHQSIGHLGIFVSTKVAKHEHRAIVDNLDVISSLAPGLYEMAIERSPEADGEAVQFYKRELDDIRRLDDSRRDEEYFLPVARVSDFNLQWYKAFVSPWIRLASNEMTGEVLRRAHPNRVRRYAWSDLNPAMALVAGWADRVRESRRPAAADNVFRQAEQRTSEQIVKWLDSYRDWRDQWLETAFYAAYAPFKTMMADDLRRFADERSTLRHEREQAAREWLGQNLLPRMRTGGVPEAVVRILLYVCRRRPAVDAARFRMAEMALRRTPEFSALSEHQVRDMLRDQFLLLMTDEAEAIASLPLLAKRPEDRYAVLNIVHAVADEVGGLDPGQLADLEAVKALLPLPAPSAPSGRDAPKPRKARAQPRPRGVEEKRQMH